MADVVKRAPFCDGAGDCRGWHDRVAELDGSQREQKPFTKK